MNLSEITGGSVLDEQRRQQLAGFITRLKPRVIEPARQDSLGWIWKAGFTGIGRPVTILTVTERLPMDDIRERPDIDAVLFVKPRHVLFGWRAKLLVDLDEINHFFTQRKRPWRAS